MKDSILFRIILFAKIQISENKDNKRIEKRTFTLKNIHIKFQIMAAGEYYTCKFCI